MTEPAFPPHIAAALDQLTVPPLPKSFGDNLIARIEAGDLPAETSAIVPPLPNPRRTLGSSGWRRSGRIVAVAAALGLATATAAASGFFGEPVYVPVVSDALARAKLVELPKVEKSRAEARKVAAKPPIASADVDPQATPANDGRKAVHDLYRRLRADPEFRALPRREKLAIARNEIRTMVDEGEITIPELRRAFAEQRARRLELRKARREAVVDMQARRQRIPAETGGPHMEEPVTPEPASDAVAAEPPAEATQPMPTDPKRRLQELRARLRAAPPAERPAIRQEIHRVWQSMGGLSPEEMDAPSEGNDPVVR